MEVGRGREEGERGGIEFSRDGGEERMHGSGGKDLDGVRRMAKPKQRDTHASITYVSTYPSTYPCIHVPFHIYLCMHSSTILYHLHPSTPCHCSTPTRPFIQCMHLSTIQCPHLSSFHPQNCSLASKWTPIQRLCSRIPQHTLLLCLPLSLSPSSHLLLSLHTPSPHRQTNIHVHQSKKSERARESARERRLHARLHN